MFFKSQSQARGRHRSPPSPRLASARRPSRDTSSPRVRIRQKYAHIIASYHVQPQRRLLHPSLARIHPLRAPLQDHVRHLVKTSQRPHDVSPIVRDDVHARVHHPRQRRRVSTTTASSTTTTSASSSSPTHHRTLLVLVLVLAPVVLVVECGRTARRVRPVDADRKRTPREADGVDRSIDRSIDRSAPHPFVNGRPVDRGRARYRRARLTVVIPFRAKRSRW